MKCSRMDDFIEMVSSHSACARCGQVGHTQSGCPMPRVYKSKIVLPDWYIDEDVILSSVKKRPRMTKPKVDLIDWENNNK